MDENSPDATEGNQPGNGRGVCMRKRPNRCVRIDGSFLNPINGGRWSYLDSSIRYKSILFDGAAANGGD